MFTRAPIVAAVVGAVLVSASIARAEKSTERLGSQVLPEFQSVHLTLDPDVGAYTGRVDVDLRVKESVEEIRFHSEGHEFTSVKLGQNGRHGDVSAERVAEDLVRVIPSEPLAPGHYELSIEFESQLGTQAVGLYRLTYEDNGYVFSQFQADDAREAFPCWDEPGFKFPYQLTITAPRDDHVVSNMPIESQAIDGEMRTTRFQRTPPFPSYLLAIAVGPFDSVEIPGIGRPGKIWTPRGKIALTKTAREMTGPLLRALEEYFDDDYPYPKLDFLAVPEFWPGAMEHPGAVTFRDALLLLDSDRSTVSQRSRLARVTAHELAHMWFGNLVTMEWWDDFWLNEAFADWMGDKIAQQVYPEFGIAVDELDGTQRIMGSDARPSSKPIRREFTAGGDFTEGLGVTYLKGKLVLGMFEGWMGAEVFRRGVQNYMDVNAFSNASASDLWDALGKASSQDVSSAMSTFLEQPGLPLVKVRRNGEGITVSQERFRPDGIETPDQTWQIPVRLLVSVDGTTRTHTFLLKDKQEAVSLPGNIDWVYPNAGAAGYSRWSLSPQGLEQLAMSGRSALSVRERVEFLGNLGALLDAGEVSGADYFRILHQFAADEAAQVVSSSLDGLGRVNDILVTEETREDFERYVRATVAPAIERFGLEPVEGEDELVAGLKPSLWIWAGRWGRDEAVRARAQELAAAYFADESAVDAQILSSVLHLAVLDGDGATFDLIRERFQSAQTPSDRARFLALLGRFSDPRLQDRALNWSLDAGLRPQEILSIPFRISDTDAGQDKALDWIFDHFEWVVDRMPPQSRGFLVSMGSGCSWQRYERVREFFESPERRMPGLANRLRRVSDGVEACVRLQEAQGESAAEYLRAFRASDRAAIPAGGDLGG